ncbi:MAG: ABC transporter ATP-binding protein [Pseudomonadota bacterium]
MNDAAFIEVSNASKSYSKGGIVIPVFEGLNLDVSKGDFITLMGPSGSGKSTLLHAIGGLEPLTEGTVRVGEEQIEKLSQSQLSRWRARTVGMIFQSFNLMPSLTAFANIELPLMLTSLSRSERRRRVETVTQLVRIDHRLKHRPRELSGGEQQRVAIARAIVADPPLLLCDEPTGELDRSASGEVMNILRTLCDELAKTIIMVTHDPTAAAYSDSVYHLEKGQLSAQEDQAA